MRTSKKIQLRFLLLRVLTLVCFFHFSGLNNGYTYLFVSPEYSATPCFATIAIQKIATPFNASFWTSLFTQKRWPGFLGRSSKVVQISSQKILQNILVESNLTQIWLQQVLKNFLCKSSNHSSFSTEEKGLLSQELKSSSNHGCCPYNVSRNHHFLADARSVKMLTSEKVLRLDLKEFVSESQYEKEKMDYIEELWITLKRFHLFARNTNGPPGRGDAFYQNRERLYANLERGPTRLQSFIEMRMALFVRSGVHFIRSFLSANKEDDSESKVKISFLGNYKNQSGHNVWTDFFVLT